MMILANDGSAGAAAKLKGGGACCRLLRAAVRVVNICSAGELQGWSTWCFA